jgi:hypothetical protein
MPKPSPEGLCEFTQKLLEQVSLERWTRLEVEARRRADVVAAVLAVSSQGATLKAALAQAHPEVHWSSFLRWRRAHETNEGAPWER